MSAKARDENGTVHGTIFEPAGDGFPGATRCGLSFFWLAWKGQGPKLERTHDFADVTCIACIAAPDNLEYNPWV